MINLHCTMNAVNPPPSLYIGPITQRTGQRTKQRRWRTSYDASLLALYAIFDDEADICGRKICGPRWAYNQCPHLSPIKSLSDFTALSEILSKKIPPWRRTNQSLLYVHRDPYGFYQKTYQKSYQNPIRTPVQSNE